MTARIVLIVSGLLLSLGACRETGITGSIDPEGPEPVEVGFLPQVVPDDNPTTTAGIALGRRLFFDPILSANKMIACTSCHRPHLAFTDGLARSMGIGGQLSKRSSPSLLNIGYQYKGLFWDGRSPSLEEQALHPVTDPTEMGSTWKLVQIRLRNHPVYPELFADVFDIDGPEEIDSLLVGKALAQFQRSLISNNSKYDRVAAGKEEFTEQEKRGWTIFFDADGATTPMAECSHCHADPLFTNLAFENNGLDRAPELTEFPDLGRGEISGQRSDNGKFKVPTLRNIAVTAPYMHDGRFRTLEEVIDHYNSGGHYAENVNPNVRPLKLSEQDKADLIVFLHTLTDSSALQNPAFQSPM